MIHNYNIIINMRYWCKKKKQTMSSRKNDDGSLLQ